MSPARIPIYLKIVDTLIERIERGDPGPGIGWPQSGRWPRASE